MQPPLAASRHIPTVLLYNGTGQPTWQEDFSEPVMKTSWFINRWKSESVSENEEDLFWHWARRCFKRDPGFCFYLLVRPTHQETVVVEKDLLVTIPKGRGCDPPHSTAHGSTRVSLEREEAGKGRGKSCYCGFSWEWLDKEGWAAGHT